jgi:hypothetical protein
VVEKKLEICKQEMQAAQILSKNSKNAKMVAENAFTNSIKLTHKDANFSYCFSIFGKI